MKKHFFQQTVTVFRRFGGRLSRPLRRISKDQSPVNREVRFCVLIWDFNHLPYDVPDEVLIAVWEADDHPDYSIECISLGELTERINHERFAYDRDYIRIIPM